MKQFQEISESEAQVMDIVWEAGRPLTSAQIIEALEETTPWKPSTVWTFLGRLTDKGVLNARKEGKRCFYTPALSREEYRQAQTRAFLREVHGGSVSSFFAALGGGAKLDRRELEELKSWLSKEAGGEEK